MKRVPWEGCAHHLLLEEVERLASSQASVKCIILLTAFLWATRGFISSFCHGRKSLQARLIRRRQPSCFLLETREEDGRTNWVNFQRLGGKRSGESLQFQATFYSLFAWLKDDEKEEPLRFHFIKSQVRRCLREPQKSDYKSCFDVRMCHLASASVPMSLSIGIKITRHQGCVIVHHGLRWTSTDSPADLHRLQGSHPIFSAARYLFILIKLQLWIWWWSKVRTFSVPR